MDSPLCHLVNGKNPTSHPKIRIFSSIWLSHGLCLSQPSQDDGSDSSNMHAGISSLSSTPTRSDKCTHAHCNVTDGRNMTLQSTWYTHYKRVQAHAHTCAYISLHALHMPHARVQYMYASHTRILLAYAPCKDAGPVAQFPCGRQQQNSNQKACQIALLQPPTAISQGNPLSMPSVKLGLSRAFSTTSLASFFLFIVALCRHTRIDTI